MDDATVKAEFRRLVQALGTGLDGQPGFGPIDIGSVGLWGEWHNWRAIISAINGDAPGSVGGEIPMPPLATCKWYVDLYFTYFPKTIKLMGGGEPAGSVTTQALVYALGRRAAGEAMRPAIPTIWRTGIFRLCPESPANTHWQTAPVYFEPYAWAHIDAASAVDFAEMAVHASAVNDRDRGRGGFTPAELPEINRLLLKLGYRFVVNNLSYPRTVSAGQPVTMTMVWQNVGVAPTYRSDVLAVQGRKAAGTPVLTSNTGTRQKWLPGTTYTVTPTVAIPAGLAPGTYTVAIGIVDPATMPPQYS